MRKFLAYIFVLTSPSFFALKRNVPAVYVTIQSALNACLQGDTVLVQPGTYQENLYWPKVSNIKMFSAGDSSNTLIDANFTGRCITIIDSTFTFIDSNTVISGFKLKNGYSDTVSFTGVAIYAWGTKPIFQSLAITNCNINAVNTPTNDFLTGGVVFIRPFNAIIKNCNFYKNTIINSSGNINGGIVSMAYNVTPASSPYGHIYNTTFSDNKLNLQLPGSGNSINGAIINGALELNKVIITGNEITCPGSSGYVELNGLVHIKSDQGNLKSVLISNNTFSCSSNANVYSLGIYYQRYGCTANVCSLTNLTIADNKAIISGSIIALSYYAKNILCGGNSGFVNVVIKNCIFWNPFNSLVNEIGVPQPFTLLTLNSNILKKHYTGLPPSNYTVNPQFISLTDHHLQFVSPAINSGYIDNSIPASDLTFNSIASPSLSFPDIGCYEMSQTTSSLSVTTSVSNLTVCLGSLVTFTDTTPNAKCWYWTVSSSQNSFNNNVFSIPTPTAGTYTVNVLVTDSSNAVGTNSFIITALAVPIPTINPGNTSICPGQSITLTASSTNTVSSYLWFNGATASSVVITPTASGAYTVVLQNSYGCSASSFAYIGIIPAPTQPTVNVVINNNNICPGPSATVSAITNGTVSSYLWNNGIVSQSFVITPSVSSTFSVLVQNINSCTSLAAPAFGYMNVYPAPVPVIIPSTTSICAGGSFTFNVVSSNTVSSYLWSNGLNTQSIVITPSVSSNFSVQVQNTYCSANAYIYVDVYVCTGISEEIYGNEIKIYPNPSDGIFFIEHQGAEVIGYELYNLTGELIQKGVARTTKEKIGLNLNKGVYIIRLTTPGQVVTTKRLIAR